MNNLYEALEICLQDIEQGADVETVLFRYPDLAEELRPILEASAGARSMAVSEPSPEVVRRNRAKVLQHAAQLRETKSGSSKRIWFASLRRLAVTLAVLFVLFVSGTGLVGASSNSLPGDNLYPVKRTWEDLRLFFTFNGQQRNALEWERENERLYELKEVLAAGRAAEVDFNGVVTSQDGNEWVVAGIRVLISNETEIRDSGIGVGSAVRVRGVTQGNDTVLADRIRLLSSDAVVPDDGHGYENDNGNENEDNSGPGSGDDRPNVEGTETPEPENDNSGSGDNSNSNENDNSNGNENSNSNDNQNDNGNDRSGSSDNGGSNDNGNDNGDDNSGGSDDNGNDSGGNDNGDDSGGGGDNSSSGSGNDGGGDDSGGGGDDGGDND